MRYNTICCAPTARIHVLTLFSLGSCTQEGSGRTALPSTSALPPEKYMIHRRMLQIFLTKHAAETSKQEDSAGKGGYCCLQSLGQKFTYV